MGKYDDIIGLPRPEMRHKRAAKAERAAQFGAFRALTGHEDAVAETARYTEDMAELDEYAIDLLNEKLLIISDRLDSRPCVTFTYFCPDGRKSGGKYITQTGVVEKIDSFEGKVVMQNGSEFPICMISEIDGEIFNP